MGTGTGWQQQLPKLHQETACSKADPHQTSPATMSPLLDQIGLGKSTLH
jgi:hypothetical protein